MLLLRRVRPRPSIIALTAIVLSSAARPHLLGGQVLRLVLFQLAANRAFRPLFISATHFATVPV